METLKPLSALQPSHEAITPLDRVPHVALARPAGGQELLARVCALPRTGARGQLIQRGGCGLPPPSRFNPHRNYDPGGNGRRGDFRTACN